MISLVLLLSSFLFAQESSEFVTGEYTFSKNKKFEYNFTLLEPTKIYSKILSPSRDTFFLPKNFTTLNGKLFECNNTVKLFSKERAFNSTTTRGPCSINSYTIKKKTTR